MDTKTDLELIERMEKELRDATMAMVEFAANYKPKFWGNRYQYRKDQNFKKWSELSDTVDATFRELAYQMGYQRISRVNFEEDPSNYCTVMSVEDKWVNIEEYEKELGLKYKNSGFRFKEVGKSDD